MPTYSSNRPSTGKQFGGAPFLFPFLERASARPFIKWVGGKGQLIPEINKRCPDGLGVSITKYAEPFIGGGAVLFDLLSKFRFEQVYISDINHELICTYKVIRDYVDDLIDMLACFQAEFYPRDMQGRSRYFYDKRARFNQVKKTQSYDVELAALFIFLNRTCFNGLYRVNAKGEYNVPVGSYKKPLICDRDNLKNASVSLRNVTTVCGDYQLVDDFVDQKTFVYFDPPYRPLSMTSNFTSYTEFDFDDDAQKRLAFFIHKLADRGAFVMASNSDPKNTNPDDNFFDELYAPLTIERIPATRMINRNASGRGKINELLIYNYATGDK